MSDRVGRRVYSLLRAHAPDALQIHEHNSNSGSALVKGSEFVPSKDELARRLKAELDSASDEVAHRLGGPVARKYLIAYGEPRRRPLIEFPAAVDLLYTTAPRFPRIVDVSIIGLSDEAAIAFIRPSDHTPSSWDETWNTPPGGGPFKILLSNKIADSRTKGS